MIDSKPKLNILNYFFFLLLLSSFFLLFHLNTGSLASWDEAIYAQVAREIVWSGNWLNLTWDGSVWLNKPPIGSWATAFFYKILGISEFSARLFSAVCGIGTILITYLLGRKLLGKWAGFLGALVLLSSAHYLRYVRFGMLDSPVTFFLSLALYFFWLGREKSRYFLFSGIAIGLAFMTKSYVGLFAFPIIWIYCGWAGEGKILRSLYYWIGVILAALIVIPWLCYETSHYRGAFIQESVVYHFFLRSTQALEGHSGGIGFYIRTLINKYHPWVPVGIISVPVCLFKAVKHKTKEMIFITVWIFSILLIVTLMKTKCDWYILPLYPALSLSVGFILSKIFHERYAIFVRVIFLEIMIVHIHFSHIFDFDYSHAIKNLSPLIGKQVPSDKKIYFYKYHEQPAGIFYLARKIVYLEDKRSFIDAAQNGKEFFCLISEKDIESFQGRMSPLGLLTHGAIGGMRFLTNQKKLE